MTARNILLYFLLQFRIRFNDNRNQIHEYLSEDSALKEYVAEHGYEPEEEIVRENGNEEEEDEDDVDEETKKKTMNNNTSLFAEGGLILFVNFFFHLCMLFFRIFIISITVKMFVYIFFIITDTLKVPLF